MHKLPKLNKNIHEIKGLTFCRDSPFGSGVSGTVIKAKLNAEDEDAAVVALKQVSSVEMFQNEANLLYDVHNGALKSSAGENPVNQENGNSENVIKLLGVYIEEETDEQSLVLEYMRKGNLATVISECKDNPLDWEKRVQIALDIAKGISCLHEKNILHRDLKPQNILLNDKLQAKICDLGTACKEEESKSGEAIGTIHYWPPEIAQEMGGDEYTYTKAGDIYSYGLILRDIAVMSPGIGMFKNLLVDDLVAKMAKGERPALPSGAVPAGFVTLIDDCCQQDSSKRLSIEEIVVKLSSMKEEAQEFDNNIAIKNLKSAENAPEQQKKTIKAPPNKLLEKLAKKPEDALFDAVKSENVKLVEALLTGITKELINKGDNEGCTVLHHAAKMANQDIYALLLEKGADVNIKNNEGLTPKEILKSYYDERLAWEYRNHML